MKKSKSLNNLSLTHSFNRNFFLIKESDNNGYNNKKLLSLIKSKLLLEKLLYLIKITQIDYLSNLQNNQLKKDINGNKPKAIKKILNNLKNDLFSLLKSNIEKEKKIQNDINNKKCLLNNNIFGGSTPKANEQKEKNKNKFSKELTHLKLLNFKIENHIDYMDIMILLKLQNIKDIKSNKTELDDDYVEIFCDNKKDKNNAFELLHEDLIDIRKLFKSIVKKKYKQNKNLERLDSEIQYIKDYKYEQSDRNNMYINTSDIINETSKEEYTQTNQFTINNINNTVEKSNSKNFEKYRNIIFNSIKKMNLEQINEIKKNNNNRVINVNNIININIKN
jgi:hypothetical protein